MQCDKYLLDVSAIQDYIKKADGSVKEKIKKKIKKIKENPFNSETKSQMLAGVRAIKVDKQRIVILYTIDDKKCTIILFASDPMKIATIILMVVAIPRIFEVKFYIWNSVKISYLLFGEGKF